jgi:predicted metal-dependent hydrolase
MDVATQTRARQAGADAVLAKSRFVQDLPELIQKHARIVDREALADDCQGQLSALARRGLELFRAGDYFEAHEELEHAWNEETGPARELYRAILQVAVAYLQIERRNYAGAMKMFLRARQWLDPLPAVCRGVQVARLRQAALQARAALEALGAERIGEFDLAALRPAEWE